MASRRIPIASHDFGREPLVACDEEWPPGGALGVRAISRGICSRLSRLISPPRTILILAAVAAGGAAVRGRLAHIPSAAASGIVRVVTAEKARAAFRVCRARGPPALADGLSAETSVTRVAVRVRHTTILALRVRTQDAPLAVAVRLLGAIAV